MTQNTQAQTLEETLNRTDLGHAISQRKKPILIAAALVVLGIIVFSVFRHQSNERKSQRLEEIYAFQSSVVDPYLKGDTESAVVVEKIQNLDSELTGSPSLAPAIFEATNKLAQEGETEAAVNILDAWFKAFDPNSYLRFFAGLRLAPLLENAGQLDRAVEVYEGLIKSNREILRGKLYLDLGRLYLEKQDPEKAKSFFDHVIKNHESTEYAKFARLYLQKIEK